MDKEIWKEELIQEEFDMSDVVMTFCRKCEGIPTETCFCNRPHKRQIMLITQKELNRLTNKEG